MFGAIPGIAVGRTFANRRALLDAGVHRALQAGIVGRAAEGAESIVLAVATLMTRITVMW